MKSSFSSTVAWLSCLLLKKSRPKVPLICVEVNKETKLVVMEVQKDILGDLFQGRRKGQKRFGKLASAKNIDGILDPGLPDRVHDNRPC